MGRDDEPRPEQGQGQKPEWLERYSAGDAPAGTPGGDPAHRGLDAHSPPPPPAAASGAPQGAGGDAWTDEDADDRAERVRRDPSSIRAEDTEPYVGLQYVARLFKIVAMVVIVALTAEIVAALVMEGPDALLPLFLELLQGAVLAAVLWGASDLTLLLIDVGHDVRAARVLLGRMSARVGGGFDPAAPPDAPRPPRERPRP